MRRGPGPADHVVSRMLTDEPQRKSRIVQYVSLQPLDFEVSSAAVRREGPQTPDEAISQNPRYEIGKRK